MVDKHSSDSVNTGKYAAAMSWVSAFQTLFPCNIKFCLDRRQQKVIRPSDGNGTSLKGKKIRIPVLGENCVSASFLWKSFPDLGPGLAFTTVVTLCVHGDG